MAPFVVCVSGLGGAGKTSFSTELGRALRRMGLRAWVGHWSWNTSVREVVYSALAEEGVAEPSETERMYKRRALLDLPQQREQLLSELEVFLERLEADVAVLDNVSRPEIAERLATKFEVRPVLVEAPVEERLRRRQRRGRGVDRDLTREELLRRDVDKGAHLARLAQLPGAVQVDNSSRASLLESAARLASEIHALKTA